MPRRSAFLARLAGATSFEQLEARLMCALDGLEADLALLNSADLLGSTQLVANSPPTVTSEVALVGGNVVHGRSAAASVRATDDAGEPYLRYSWQVVSAPAGGGITFAANGSNSAKNNLLTFSRAGTYEIRVLIRDRSGGSTTSELRFEVAQSLSSLVVSTAEGRTINARLGLAVTCTSQQLVARAYDQFGVLMAQQPDVNWTAVSAPAGGSMLLTPEGAAVTAEFDRVGTYALRAQAGATTFNATLKVTPSLSSISLASMDGAPLQASQPLLVAGARQQLRVGGLDQFGQSMASLPALTWSLTTGPTSARLSATSSGSTATLAFTQLGLHAVRAQYGNATFDFAAEVVATLTSIRVLGADQRVIAPGRAVTVTGLSYQLATLALDQFGNALVDQPEISWQSAAAPSGGSVSLSADGNSAAATFSRAGSYALRAQSGSTTTTILVNVVQSLTTIGLATREGLELQAQQSLLLNDARQTLYVRAFDQFGNQITAPPRLTWTTTSAPVGGRMSAAVSSTSVTLAFNRSGAYAIRAQYGSMMTEFTVDVVSTLKSISVTTADHRSLTTNRPWAVAGTSVQLSAVGFDQFGVKLADQPSITWQSVSAPTGGAATLAVQGNVVTAEFSRAGSYVLRAECGGISFLAAVNATQVLTSLGLALPDGTLIEADQTLQVTAASQSLSVRGVDQFGQAMNSLPRLSWSTTVAPVGGKVASTSSGSNVVLTFNRVGTYALRAQYGNAALTFSAEVVATLTSIGVRTADHRLVTAGRPFVVTGASQALTAVALDQFGFELAQQPEISWQVTAAPAGAPSLLTPAENGCTATFSRAGTYGLRATADSVTFDVVLSVRATIASIGLVAADGSAIDPNSPVISAAARQDLSVRGFDQFGNAMAALPTISWTKVMAPTGGTASVSYRGAVATLSFTRAGSYTMRAQAGVAATTVTFQLDQVLTSAAAISGDGRQLNTRSPVSVSTAEYRMTARGLDQFGQAMAVQPEFAWSIVSAPAGSAASLNQAVNEATLAFSSAGPYVFRATSDTVVLTVALNVLQRLSSITLTPGTGSLEYSSSQQYVAQAYDQFQELMSAQPTFTWSATGGKISSRGLFTAGRTAGTFAVTARYGSVSGTAAVQITAPAPQTELRDAALASLVYDLYADNQVSRADMIQILRSAGNDGVVSATELADLQFLVSSNASFVMPDYVRELARDVVHNNPANLKFRGQAAGNLTAGSSAALLNNLVDKWFLGADDPLISTSGLSYQTSSGALFVGTPSRADARQGMLGDCYFIASLAAIADENPTAVRDMFLDNGDGTFTVRFYAGALGSFYSNGLISAGFVSGSGVADYVTVSRRLPAYANGMLGYSGYGLSIASSNTPLWIALAEKAYAQWNETGQAGRDGTNRYAAIEGGWMSNVNAQVLGYNSTSYTMSSSYKQAMITALSTGQAVTIGTSSYASTGGLVGSHAYIVTAYQPASDTFLLHNPWGTSHPAALTWAQLQGNCTMFVVANPLGSGAVAMLAVHAVNDDELAAPLTVDVGAESPPSLGRGNEVMASGDKPIISSTMPDGLSNLPARKYGTASDARNGVVSVATSHELDWVLADEQFWLSLKLASTT